MSRDAITFTPSRDRVDVCNGVGWAIMSARRPSGGVYHSTKVTWCTALEGQGKLNSWRINRALAEAFGCKPCKRCDW